MDNSIMDNSIFIKHNECYACVISLGSNYTDEFQTAIGYCSIITMVMSQVN